MLNLTSLAKVTMAVAIIGLWAGAAQADLVTGGSFETPDIADGTNDVVDATSQTWDDGWSSADNAKSGLTYGAGREDPSTDKTGQTGEQYAKMTFAYTTSQDQWVKIYSPILGTVQADYTYNFQVGMTWDRDYANGTQPSLTTIWGSSNKVTLWLNGQAFERNHGTLPEDTFTERSIQVVVDASGNLQSTDADTAPTVGTPLAGGDVQVQLMAGRAKSSGGTGPTHMLFDNVRVNLPAVSDDLTIRKFFDCDLDNTYDAEDKYLSGWQFNVSNTGHGGSYDQNFTTDANGEINIIGLAAGDYDVTETVKGTGWVLAAANPRTVTVSGATTVDFGNQLPGDANQDEKVNLSDFTILKAHFGEDPAGWTYGNFNTDTTVNLSDFTILKANFGLGAPSAGGVPEPATVAMLALGAAALLRRRRA